MKRVKVWWDFDDERYSQEAYLVEEDADVVVSVGSNHVVSNDFHELLSQNGLVGFREIDRNEVFALGADMIVKIEVLEE